jgi:hypothetical protein
VHASLVLLNVLLRRLDLLLNLLGDVDNDLDGSVLAKVLTQVGVLDVGGMLPAAVILEQIKGEHASPEFLGIRVVLERPLHADAAFVYASFQIGRSASLDDLSSLLRLRPLRRSA